VVLPAGSGAFIPIPSKEMGIPAPFFKTMETQEARL
jgi:hypothetical protein